MSVPGTVLALALFASLTPRASAAPGDVDPTFATGPLGIAVNRVAVQADGKAVIAGTLTNYNGFRTTGLLRLNSDGTPDAGFNLGAGFQGTAIAIPGFAMTNAPQFFAVVPTSAGLVVGGAFDKVNGQARTNLVRLLANGTVDPAFAPRLDGNVVAVAVQTDGKLLIGGAFKNVNGVARNALARLNADGSLDAGFVPDWGTVAGPSARVIAVQADGKILVGGGHLVLAGGLAVKPLVRLNANGSLDTSFHLLAVSALTESVGSIVLQATGKIVVAGTFAKLDGVAHKGIARLNADGTLDATWPGAGIGSGGLESVSGIIPGASGQILAGGRFESINGFTASGVARMSADGVVDTTFKKPAGSTTFWVDALGVQSDGKVVVVGTFTLGTGSDTTKTVLRLLGEGTAVVPVPTIVTQPVGSAFTLNATGQSLSVQATGTPPLSYQWFKDGKALEFKTDATLAFSQVFESTAGSYTVVVTNPGGAVTSVVAQVTVNVPVKITTQPASVAATDGEAVSFTVGVSGTPPITYRWRKGTTEIPGANTATLSLPAVTLADAGSYSVVVENAAGNETSHDAVLTVKPGLPRITEQPAGQSVVVPDANPTAAALVGRKLRLTVRGALPPWIDHGTYEITFGPNGYASPAGGALTNASAGGYGVGLGTAPVATLIDFANFFPDGEPARLTLVPGGIFEFNQADLIADQNGLWEWIPPYVPTNGPTVALAVTAVGTAPLAFQWQHDGVPLAGRTNATLTLTNVQVADLGGYTVEVSNAAGRVTSTVATLTVGGDAPAIVRQPQPQALVEGASLTLSVEATGAAPLVYVWEKLGTGFVPGGSAATFSLAHATAADAGRYQVTIRNARGEVRSEVVEVSVCATGAPATFLGRPWVKVAETGMAVPGTVNRFGPWSTPYKPRLTLRDRTLHFSARAAEAAAALPGVGASEFPLRAILRWRSGTLETLVFTNTPAPGGGRFADSLYVTDETDGAVNFGAAVDDGKGNGLFELRGGTIVKLADETTPRPGGSGHFLGFGSLVRRGSTLVWGSAFSGANGGPGGVGIYALRDGRISVLVDDAGNLPGVVGGFGGLPSNFGLGFDGVNLALACASADLSGNAGAFRLDLAGQAAALASTGDPVPGGAGLTFGDFEAADVDGGPVFFLARGEAFAAAGGTVQRLHRSATSLAAAGGGLVYLASGSLVVRRDVASATDETVLPADAVLDCRRVRRVWQVDAQGDDVTIGVDFTDGSSAIFVNLGAGAVAPGATLRAPAVASGQLEFGLPTVVGKTYEVQFRGELGAATWSTVQTVTGDGSVKPVKVPVSGQSGFVRVGER